MRKIIYPIIAITILSCTNQERKLPDTFDFGKTENDSYKNDYFEMEIFFNANWVIQDEQQMNNLIEASSEIVAGDDEILKAAVKAAQVNTAYLLSIFKYEVGSAVQFNPSFMVIAENTKNSPGVKDGSDYLFHVKKLLEQSQMPYYFEKNVFEKIIGESTFHIMETKMDHMNQIIIQEYISTVTKGFCLSFVVSYTTEDERDELYEIIDEIKI